MKILAEPGINGLGTTGLRAVLAARASVAGWHKVPGYRRRA